jgi:hypothetical protein
MLVPFDASPMLPRLAAYAYFRYLDHLDGNSTRTVRDASDL